MKSSLAWGCVAAFAAILTPPLLAQEAAKPAPAKVDLEALASAPMHFGEPGGGGNPAGKFRDFNDLTRGAQRIDGFLTLYQKDEHLYAEIKPHQFEQPMLAPIVISKGMGSAGTPLNFGDEWVVLFHRAGDRVQLIRRNVHYKAPSGTPIERAVKQNYTDSILMALPIQSLNPGGGMSVVIDLNDIFFNDFAQLGSYDRSKTTWHKIKAFPNNLELQVETTVGGGVQAGMTGGDDGVIDYRGATIVVHYSLVKLPDPGYRPRYADDRVGHFLNATKDFGHADPDTNFVRMINRWRIEKADPSAKMSPPKHRMIWWVENTVPDEYRPYVQSGIEEWNKAFEAVGIRNAIEVRWQTDKDEFDPEDINYCTFKWITTSQTYAMSCLRSNPLTGEMIDGDVIFDAGFIKSYKKEYALLTGTAANGQEAGEPIAVGEILSPILAAKKGYGLPNPLGFADPGGAQVRPAEWTELQAKLRRRIASNGHAGCRYSCGMQYEMGLASLAMADAGKAGAGEAMTEEFIGQGIKEIVMHEVGHSLGLRHNFKASTMLASDKLHDQEVTRKKGLVGSVMDYCPINIAPKGQKQGDYYTTTIGPYDYWAIEYAYKPIDGNEDAELKKIAARAPEADLSFATDDDLYGGNDPQVNMWDLGQDPCKFALDRIDLANALLKDLDAKAVKDGQSWVKNRDAFSIVMAQYGNAASLIGGYVGGQSVHRDHKGDKDGRDPVVPVSGAKQREALKLLVEKVLSDKAFQFSPALLRRMGSEKWMHWGASSRYERADVAILERVLGIQEIALDSCLNASTLAQLENQEMQTDAGGDPLKLAEVFRALSDGVWSELTPPAEAKNLAVTTIRRNLQRDYLKRLATMVLGEKPRDLGGSYRFVLFYGSQGKVPADARALSRLHLREVADKIAKVLENKALAIDDTTKAHLEESKHRIAKVLDASLEDNQP